ncbi:putative lysine N-acyltransferase C17G9.06c [Grifola frondosa]|uniref:Putative lysine N-acyltransferase C17G9.06c n=1 Tax=Grifola frondosa TaxID=5627 RepID=A0A1C7ML58_GRIFR|nr:putative lysine N-acyltransferase C17G9.06c [Grifola frondosa]
MDNANRRLQAIQRSLAPGSEWRRVLVLPDNLGVDVTVPKDAQEATQVAIDNKVVGLYRTLPRSVALVISALGTPHENTADHVPKFPVLEISSPSVIYALHTVYHVQETIPIILSPSIQNGSELTEYLITLAWPADNNPSNVRAKVTQKELFLMRETFWQGAGTSGYHTRGWLRVSTALKGRAPFPYVQSFTRTDLVIASHPLRPPKPPGRGDDETVGRHLAAFHKWHNSDHVNRGWGERGPIEKHREYIKNAMADPAVQPLMMSWDGELMGYCEIVWIKENHVAPYVPEGARDYDRGLHVLVGEEKLRGTLRSTTCQRPKTKRYQYFSGSPHECPNDI